MKLRQSINILLIALFVWAFQSATIHFHHQEIDVLSECNICHASEQLKGYQHNTSVVSYSENVAVNVREYAKKVVVQPRYDYTQVPLCKEVESTHHQECTVNAIPLGYHATAPPYFFS